MKRSPATLTVFLLTIALAACPATEEGPTDTATEVAPADTTQPDVAGDAGSDAAPDDVVVCVPQCAGLECGDDSCGGDCGVCPSCPGAPPLACQGGVCPVTCCPSCSGKSCGGDDCGGVCGVCDSGEICQGASCVGCVGECSGKDCGGDGCGTSCGTCSAGLSCQAGTCVSDCTADCAGKTCGDDGCGGSCGTCSGQGACQGGTCTCVPACAGLECGDDGCGGDCGPCAGSDVCAVGECIPPAAEAVYSTFIGDWEMTPGKEVTKCVVKRLSNTTPIIVDQIHTKLAAGSHHLIVYRTNETTEQATPFNCTPFQDTLGGGAAPLMITEVPEETLTFPPGVGIMLEAHQMIRIEAHFLNYYPQAITAHGDVDFHTADGSEISDLADFMFYGTTQFNVPGNGTQYSTDWKWLPTFDDINVFAVTGHTHQWGTNVEITRSTGVNDAGQVLYPGTAPFLWSEAPVEKFDPPIVFGPGDGFRFKCTWVNTSGSSTGFGASANEEMCFLWAYYYPSKGYTICADGLFGFLCP